MFRRPRPVEDQYLPTPLRVVTIVHLCWIFTYLIWVTAKPVLNDHIAFKTQMALAKTVMGHEDLAAGLEGEEHTKALAKLRAHRHHFEQLAPADQEKIRAGYAHLLARPSEGSSAYFREVGKVLVAGIPPFVQGYLFFSLIVCFFLLFRIEGAAPAAWILPVILIVFMVVNQRYAPDRPPTAEANLFPEESQIVEDYLHGQLSENVAEQLDQLTRGWEDYLIDVYAKETPSSTPEKRQQQLLKGEFWFNLARLDAWQRPTPPHHGWRREVRGNLLLQLVALGWTLFFAGFVNRKSLLLG